MKLPKLSEKKWFNGAVITCIGVAFFVFLTNFRTVLDAVGTFVGYFKPVILGVVFAYIINPLTKLFYYRVFSRMKIGKLRWGLSVFFSFGLMMLALFLLISTLLPQLAESIIMFSENFDGYADSLINVLREGPLKDLIDDTSLDLLSENALAAISVFLDGNVDNVASIVASSGKNILSTVIALILAVYLLIDSKNVLIAARKLLQTFLPEDVYETVLDFILRCDTILVNYITHSLIDALIIGTANAIFMFIFRMPYIGLISVVVGVTNLVPNFGPAIGAVIGAFILLLINPAHAVLFLGFCALIQFVDAYILKPKLFSGSLGVSGLSILISTIVLGNMFGILGVLLSIPTAAILSFLYNDYLMAGREKKVQ